MFNKLIGVVMKAKSIAALLVASCASVAAPAFAGGYGQTLCDSTGAPVSQRGQTAKAKATAYGQHSVIDRNRSGVGGAESGRSQSGRRAPSDSIDPMYRGG
jgi:hypothetical protein